MVRNPVRTRLGRRCRSRKTPTLSCSGMERLPGDIHPGSHFIHYDRPPLPGNPDMFTQTGKCADNLRRHTLFLCHILPFKNNVGNTDRNKSSATPICHHKLIIIRTQREEAFNSLCLT